MVCFRYKIVNALHEGDNKNDDDDDDDNDNNKMPTQHEFSNVTDRIDSSRQN